MKILLVGASGQLGMDCKNVLASKHQLVTPTRSELDLGKPQQTREYIAAQAPDIIINCAAYTAVDMCEEEQDLCRRINGEAPGILAQACQSLQSRLIHISTDYVFDGKKKLPQPYTETDEVNPLCHYGHTKLMGEHGVQKYSENFVILRTAWLYSAKGPNFLKTILRLSLANPEEKRKVVDDQFGSLTWSLAVARQISLLLGSEVQGIVHATATGYSTWYEVACFFLEQLGIQHNIVPCTTEEYPTLAQRPANSILANTELENKKLSVFVHWQEDLTTFIQQYGQKLLEEHA